jgi:riboflavin kinase / FMN adenylyltransferase
LFRAEAFGNPAVLSEKVCLTFGNFDGFHLGHQSLVSELKSMSDMPKVVVTFSPHPSVVVGAQPKPLLYSLNQRIRQLIAAGVDCVCVQEFGPQFAEMNATEFCQNYLKHMFSIESVLFGFNFKYGKNREGDWSHFRNFAAHEHWNFSRALPVLHQGLEVSSTLIRQAIQQAKLSEAEAMLGRSYELFGTVVEGDKRGREIGFPTANLALGLEGHVAPTVFETTASDLVLPYSGVYAVKVRVEDIPEALFGVMNCGFRPTIANGLRHQIEAHIFDFEKDIYGRKISFELKKFLRSEQKFLSLNELKIQIDKDCEMAKLYFDSILK